MDTQGVSLSSPCSLDVHWVSLSLPPTNNSFLNARMSDCTASSQAGTGMNKNSDAGMRYRMPECRCPSMETRGSARWLYGTLVIEVCLFLNFAVVFSSTYFRFLVQVLGDFHVIRPCALCSKQVNQSYNAPILMAHRCALRH
jgi:hypothetical protein